jgi:hypothetical protein
VLAIYDVTASIGGQLMDLARNVKDAQERIATNGNMGYVYAVRIHEPLKDRGVPVAAFRLCGRATN